MHQAVQLFIDIFSTANDFKQRMAVRRTWVQYDSVRTGVVVMRFFVGLHKNLMVNEELWDEAGTCGDIQLMPFVDYYSLITLKTIAICIYGEWLDDKYPRAHGPGYAVSHDIAESVCKQHKEGILRDRGHCTEHMDRRDEKERINIKYVNGERIHIGGCEAGYVLAHYQESWEMLYACGRNFRRQNEQDVAGSRLVRNNVILA